MVLSGCAPEQLRPEEVLRRSVIASQRLSSAWYAANVSVRSDRTSRTQFALQMNVSGVIRDGGHAFSGSGALGISSVGPRGRHHLSLAGDYSRISLTESYLRLLAIDPVSALPKEVMTGAWLRLSKPDPQVEASQPATPDAMMLLLQAQAVNVTEDMGFEDVGGRKAYHYRVTLDTGMLAGASKNDSENLRSIDAQGELWIAVDSFDLLKAAWKVRLPDSAGALDLDALVSFSGHGTAARLFTAPAEAIDVDLEHVFAIFSSGSLLPPGLF